MNVSESDSRRQFLLKALASCSIPMFGLNIKSEAGYLKETFTVLFQGDSITDGNRGRNEDPNHILGHGYAFSIASSLGAEYPSRGLGFVNRGVSGDKVSDLRKRWKTDALDLRPDLISILVGVNDILASMKPGAQMNFEDFENEYRELLTSTKKALPDTVLAIGQPFILPVGMVLGNKERWMDLTQRCGLITERLAKEHHAIFIPYQEMFNDAAKKISPDYWIWDGIHPTYAGHGLMAKIWLQTVLERCQQFSPVGK
jgi:lysophospholipase L1-like esterase